MGPKVVVRMRCPFPDSSAVEATCIDDHVAVSRVPRRGVAPMEAAERVRRSQRAIVVAGAVEAKDKIFYDHDNAVLFGGPLEGPLGLLGALEAKRSALACASLQLARGGQATLRLM